MTDRRWYRHLMHPAPLAAALVLLANDHVLKGASLLPNWLTGKLSDFSGLFLFPVVVVSALRAAGIFRTVSLQRERAWIWAVVVSTSAVFSALQLWSPAHAVVSAMLGPNVMDPTDLIALPAALLAGRYLRSTPDLRIIGPRIARGIALTGCAFACAATSPPPQPPPPPPPPTLARACATATPVSCRAQGDHVKIAVSVQRGTDMAACRVRVSTGYTTNDDGTTASLAAARPDADLGPEATLYILTGSLASMARPIDASVQLESHGQDHHGNLTAHTSTVTGFRCDGAAKPTLQVAE